MAPGDTTVDTGGEFVKGVGDPGFPSPECPILPRLRPISRDGPELGQAGIHWVRETAIPVAPDEFATSVTVGSTPNATSTPTSTPIRAEPKARRPQGGRSSPGVPWSGLPMRVF